MPLYKCILCDYESKQKNDYNRHLKTKKHLTNKKNYDLDIEKNIKETQKRPKRDPKETQKRPERDPIETRLPILNANIAEPYLKIGRIYIGILIKDARY